jgi:hypothetical protein
MSEIDTSNSQFVGSYQNSLVVQVPRPMRTRQDAHRHAAWIVACAEVLPDDPDQINEETGKPYTFEQYLHAVMNA